MSEEASFLRGKVEQDKDQQLVSVNSSRQEAGQMAGGVECFVGDRDRVDHLSMDPMVLEALGNREVQTKMKIGGQVMQDGQDTLSYSECVDAVYGAGLTTVGGEMQFPSENTVQGEPAPGASSATVGSDFLHPGDPSDDYLQNTVAGRPTAPKTARTEAAPDTV